MNLFYLGRALLWTTGIYMAVAACGIAAYPRAALSSDPLSEAPPKYRICSLGSAGLYETFPVRALAFSNNKTLVTLCLGSDSPTLWESATGARLAGLPHDDVPVNSIAISPQSGHLLTGDAANVLRIWSLAHRRVVGQRLLELPTRQIAVSRKNELATLLLDDGTIELISSATGNRLRSWPAQGRARYTCHCLSPSGTILVVGCADRSIRVLGPPIGSEVRVLRGLSEPATFLSFSSDGCYLIAATPDESGRPDVRGEILVWDVSTFQVVYRYVISSSKLLTVAVSPVGRAIAAGFDNGQISWIDFASKRVKSWTAHPIAVRSLAISQDGRRLASGAGRRVKVWDTDRNAECIPHIGHDERVVQLVLGRDKRAVMSVGAEGRVLEWDIRKNTCKTLSLDGHIHSPPPVLSGDGRFLIGGGVMGVDLFTKRDQGYSRDAEIGTGAVMGMTMSSNKELMAILEASGPLRIVRCGDRKFLHTVEVGGLDERAGAALSFSADGRFLALLRPSGDLLIWHVGIGTPLEFGEVWGKASAVAFGPGGERAFVAGLDGQVTAWDLMRKKLIRVVGATEKRIICLAVSGDGKVVAAGTKDQGIYLWELGSGRLRLVLGEGSHGASCLLFSDDSSTLVSGGDNGTLAIWDVRGAKGE